MSKEAKYSFIKLYNGRNIVFITSKKVSEDLLSDLLILESQSGQEKDRRAKITERSVI